MSEDWDIRCVDCGVNYGFYDSNHREEEMWLLIEHAKNIAALATLAHASVPRRGRLGIVINSEFGDIDPVWFEAHKDHKLVPVNEYARLSGQCYRSTECGHCGTSLPCTMKLHHEGPCNADVEFRAR